MYTKEKEKGRIKAYYYRKASNPKGREQDRQKGITKQLANSEQMATKMAILNN